MVAPFLKPSSNAWDPIYEMKSFINGTFQHFSHLDHSGFVIMPVEEYAIRFRVEINLSVSLPLNMVASICSCSSMDADTLAQGVSLTGVDLHSHNLPNYCYLRR